MGLVVGAGASDCIMALAVALALAMALAARESSHSGTCWALGCGPSTRQRMSLSRVVGMAGEVIC
jgi:pyruvate/2-oxoglutarate dehydrogenase complex dihydrolipoamide dehydrogenase (E3) component